MAPYTKPKRPDIVYSMDANNLLTQVSDAYRRLRTLSVTAIQLIESGDENSSTSSRTRLRFLYASPNRIRFEQLGNQGIMQVADGEDVHIVFPRMAMAHGPRYSSMPTSRMPFLPHSFRSEFPLTGDAVFLFAGIEKNVESAEVVGQEDGCFIVSVRYAPSTHASIIPLGPSISYWVRTDDRMVMRQQGRIGHRRQGEQEIAWSSHTISVDSLTINQDLPDETFRFTPPADATSAACGVNTGGSRGFIGNGTNHVNGVEHRGSHSWEGETLVEQSRWKLRGQLLQFERRLSFSADGTEVRVGERIQGPKGTVDGEFVVPVD
jgi:hypothetical protein